MAKIMIFPASKAFIEGVVEEPAVFTRMPSWPLDVLFRPILLSVFLSMMTSFSPQGEPYTTMPLEPMFLIVLSAISALCTPWMTMPGCVLTDKVPSEL